LEGESHYLPHGGGSHYLRNPIDVGEILYRVSWEEMSDSYCPPLVQWDQSAFLTAVDQALEPGIEAMWRVYDLDDPTAMAEHIASIDSNVRLTHR